MFKITSRDNQKLKKARKICNGDVRDLMFVEGARLSEEALSSPLQIEEIFISENFAKNARSQKFLDKVSKKHIFINEVSEKIFPSLSDTKTSQGVILIAKKPETGKGIIEKSLQGQRSKFPLLILLHQINNPSNLGAILRTAEAANVSGVIFTKNSADVFSPKALRASMGAGFRLPIWTNTDFFDVLDWSKRENFVTVAAAVNAEKSYLDIEWQQPRLLIFGSEAHGLNPEESNKIDESIVIPMENDVESLNLAVSCGIILFEAKRQRDKQIFRRRRVSPPS